MKDDGLTHMPYSRAHAQSPLPNIDPMLGTYPVCNVYIVHVREISAARFSGSLGLQLLIDGHELVDVASCTRQVAPELLVLAAQELALVLEQFEACGHAELEAGLVDEIHESRRTTVFIYSILAERDQPPEDEKIFGLVTLDPVFCSSVLGEKSSGRKGS